jgi:hypothetical protein
LFNGIGEFHLRLLFLDVRVFDSSDSGALVMPNPRRQRERQPFAEWRGDFLATLPTIPHPTRTSAAVHAMMASSGSRLTFCTTSVRRLDSINRKTTMNVLLAIDESACSAMAVETVAKQFSPETTEIRVLNVINWPGGAPTILPFAEGPVAADHVLGWDDELRRTVASWSDAP